MSVSKSEVIDAIRRRVVDGLERERNDRAAQGIEGLSGEDEQRLSASLAQQALGDIRATQIASGQEMPDATEDQQILNSVRASMFGLGPMQDLLDDPRLIEVNMNGADRAWVLFDDGRKALARNIFASDAELISWVQAQAMYSGLSSRAWDPANPIVEFQLPGGHRLVGVQAATARPALSIRLRRRHDVCLNDLLALGDFDERLAGFLRAAVASRMNMIISGETGSGKTTLMRGLISEIPPSERLVVVEHFAELGVDEQPDRHPDVVVLEERVANAEGVGEVSMTRLVRTSRRLDPDRILVGECVGEEVVDMLDALSQGNTGGMTTIHARSARAVPSRVATYAQRVGMNMTAALQLVSVAVDFIVHMAKVRQPDGTQHRMITSVVEVIGFDGDQVLTSEVFTRRPDGVYAVPTAAISQERTEQLAYAGWNSAHAADIDGVAHTGYRAGVIV